MLTWWNLVNNKSANMTQEGAKRKQHEYNQNEDGWKTKTINDLVGVLFFLEG